MGSRLPFLNSPIKKFFKLLLITLGMPFVSNLLAEKVAKPTGRGALTGIKAPTSGNLTDRDQPHIRNRKLSWVVNRHACEHARQQKH